MNPKEKIWLTTDRPNLLLTSAGRRAYMVRWFKQAMKGEGRIHVVNSSSISTAMKEADASEISPLIYSQEYIPFLLDYCEREKIGALIPLFDVDVPIIAKNAGLFKELGCFPVVPSDEVATMCNDKYATWHFLERNNIETIPTFLGIKECREAISSGLIDFPIIVKPRWGMGSIGIFEVADKTELVAITKIVQREVFDSYLRFESNTDKTFSIIYQPKISASEFGLDIVNNLQGNFVAYSAKKKEAMRAGETDCARILRPDDRFKDFSLRLSSATQHLGNMDVDVFDDDGTLRVLEMNARFGGGYPFSHAAGMDIPLALVEWLRGVEPSRDSFRLKRFGVFQKDITIMQL